MIVAHRIQETDLKEPAASLTDDVTDFCWCYDCDPQTEWFTSFDTSLSLHHVREPGSALIVTWQPWQWKSVEAQLVHSLINIM